MNPMDFSTLAVTDVTHAMQLALGPVFLLNGIGILLSLLTSRLARIVDRARGVEAALATADEAQGRDMQRELGITSRRARLVNRAITLGTIAALLVAVVVALLFAAAFIGVVAAPLIAVLFVSCMAALVGSLWCFLVEVRVATAALRIGQQRWESAFKAGPRQ